MVTAYIGLGSNLGDREQNIREAVCLMGEIPGIRVVKVSTLMESKPVGPTDQPDYLNGAAAIETTLDPLDLLEALQSVEARLGRVRSERWGPRTLDLDILLYGDDTIDDPRLKVPHPEMTKRDFVMRPLQELQGTPCG